MDIALKNNSLQVADMSQAIYSLRACNFNLKLTIIGILAHFNISTF